MKIFKKGFTLAELLLVLGIIGIVTALGAGITKKATDKAYNLYFYNGFVNLYDAFVDTIINNNNVEDSIAGGPQCTVNIKTPICHINNLLGTTQYNNEANFTVVAKNGVTYEFLGNNEYSNLSMGVPQPKTRQNPEGKVYVAIKMNCNAYGHNEHEFIVPLDPKYYPLSGPLASRTYISLGDRRDLLPAYLDNGLVGRVKGNLSRTSTAQTNIAYYTYNQALCSYIQRRKSGAATVPQDKQRLGTKMGASYGNIILDCTDSSIGSIPDYNDGIIKFADPRKAR